MSTKICLIGSIPKGDDVRTNWKDWKTEYREVLSKIQGVEIVDGDDWKDETQPFILLGHDSNLVKTSDIVIVDAKKKLGAGTAQEMVIAKYFKRPLISVIPKDTHHRRSNIVFDGSLIDDWVHPFLLTLSDVVVEDINEAKEWVEKYISNSESIKVKDISIIDEAIDAYLNYEKN